jgi:hypothetical protein
MEDTIAKKDDGDRALTSFLARTKEGKYAPVDQVALAHLRMPVESEFDIAEYEEDFYYSIG